MERVNRMLLVVAGVTAVLLAGQFLLINEMSAAYLSDGALRREQPGKTAVYRDLAPLPVVLMHGMGDAAGNGGMQKIQKAVAKELGGVYVANVQLGNSVAEDVQNSFFVTMDNQAAMFAKVVQADPRLAKGFNAAGFSQGNLVIRAYIERYNDPPVVNFVSLHGPLAGVGALPQCKPTEFICKEIDRLIGEAVYTKRVQERIAQSNYFRDPLRIDDYLKYAEFLPDLNNERTPANATYKANFARLQQLVLVRAESDTQVFPKESEWFGAYRDADPYKQVLGFNETRWYREDSFGLRTLDEAGKVHLLSTPGNHLQFSMDFLLGVVRQYFSSSLQSTV